MKTKRTNFGTTCIMALAFLFISSSLYAQYSYQAVVRDGDGDLVANQSVSVKISLVKHDVISNSDQAKYVEEHTATTNDNGLLSIVIGDGTATTGDISDIAWVGYRSSPFSSWWYYKIKAEFDITGQGSNYTLSAEERVSDVPRATYAEKSSIAANGAVAYGFIQSDGTISNGKGIESVYYYSALGYYDITLSDESYNSGECVVIANGVGGPYIISASTAPGGHIGIDIWGLDGNPTQANFQFAVFDPNKD